jgi:hypothetical protein
VSLEVDPTGPPVNVTRAYSLSRGRDIVFDPAGARVTQPRGRVYGNREGRNLLVNAIGDSVPKRRGVAVHVRII